MGFLLFNLHNKCTDCEYKTRLRSEENHAIIGKMEG